ncbi:MAG: glucokinase, partial [Chromatocurvus sp.]
MQLAGKDHDLLVADIGGTNSRFAIADGEPGGTGLRGVTRYTNAGVDNFAAQLARYRDSINAPLPERACIAVAGPTDGERASLTNGSWQFDAANLAGTFGFSKIALINDFTALASSVHSLQAAQLQRLKPGTAVTEAPLCVIGPGTGLGVACVVSPGSGQTVIPTEGGHVDLAAVTEQEWRLRQWLREQVGASVSAEHALCGAGLRRIDAFLREDPTTLRAVDTITQEALSGNGSGGRQAVDLFLALLAQE